LFGEGSDRPHKYEYEYEYEYEYRWRLAVVGDANADLGRHLAPTIQRLLKPLTPAREPRHDRAERDVEHLRGLGVGHVLDGYQQDDAALARRKRFKRAIEILMGKRSTSHVLGGEGMT